MNHEHHFIKEGLHIGFEVAKLSMKAVGLVAAFLIVKEIHNLHKSLEHHKK